MPGDMGQNIGRSAMGLNPVTGMMDMAQQGGDQLLQLLPLLMKMFGGGQQPMMFSGGQSPGMMGAAMGGIGSGGNPISGVGMPQNIPLKQKMVR